MCAACERRGYGDTAFTWTQARPALDDDGASVRSPRRGFEHITRLVTDLPAGGRALLLLRAGAAREREKRRSSGAGDCNGNARLSE
jgi:hypothetical protein